MPQPAERNAVIMRLREEIRRMERRPARRGGSVRSGVAAVDALLPGGFPRGALAELAGGPASGKTAVALAVFAALGPRELAAYVDGRGEIYPPAAAALGVDLERLLLVRTAEPSRAEKPEDILATLWAAEALLECGAFAAVAIDMAHPRSLRGGDAIARRLQAAVEKGGAIGLWLTPPRGALRVPASIRLVLSSEGGAIAAQRADGFVAEAPPLPRMVHPKGGAGAA